MADMLPNEQVHVWDIDNGSRSSPTSSRASRQRHHPGERRRRPARPQGDKVIVASFGSYDEADLERYAPVVVHVDEQNNVTAVDSDPSVLLDGVNDDRRLCCEHPTAKEHPRREPADPTADRAPVTLPRIEEMKRNDRS